MGRALSVYGMKQPLSIVHLVMARIRILCEAGRRGEQGLPERSDVARCEATIDLEVGSGHVTAIVGGNWVMIG